jgi:hypothetical protein
MIIIYILLALVALVLIRAAFVGNDLLIEKNITIARSAQDTFDYVKLLRNHRYFNKWTMADPNVQITYSGNDGEPGFSSHWTSTIKNVGEGTQTISSVVANARIDYNLEFVKPFKDTAGSYLAIEVAANGTCTVKWGFTGQRNFMQKIMHVLINIEKMLGNDLQISLENLKLIVEK